MTAIAIDKDPYLVSYGRRGDRWEEVAEELHRQGLCQNSNAMTIKHKVEALIKHQQVCSHT